ncbi:MAG: uL22 family ribosomal protein [Patescibacteria group bacterium]
MQIVAFEKYIHVSPRKLGLVVDSVKHLSPLVAVAHLKHLNKSGAVPLKKAIDAALANSKQKNLKEDELLFAHIEVLPGSSMRRFRAVSRGMAHSYRKRMSHIKVILTEKPKTEKKIIQNIKKVEKK